MLRSWTANLPFDAKSRPTMTDMRNMFSSLEAWDSLDNDLVSSF